MNVSLTCERKACLLSSIQLSCIPLSMAILLDHVGFRICFSHLVGITTGQSVICINPVPIQKIDGKEKPKISLKFAKHAARYNEFGYNWSLISVLKLKLTVSLKKCCCWDVAFKHPISSWSVERVYLQMFPSEFKKVPSFTNKSTVRESLNVTVYLNTKLIQFI